MLPRDAEDEARIAYHVRRRQGLGLQTIEWGRRIDRCQLPRAGATVLVDSVTALVQNELLQADGVFPAGPTQVAQQLLAFSCQAAHVIFVTDYIYSDAGHYNTLTQHYCKCLAQTDRALAAACDTVAEICGATVTLHKGTLPLLLEPSVGAAVRELVIAGTGQGALDYVQQTYGVGREQLYFCRDDAPPDFSAHYVCGLEHYVRYCLTAGQTPRLGFDPAAGAGVQRSILRRGAGRSGAAGLARGDGALPGAAVQPGGAGDACLCRAAPAVKITHYGSGRRVGQ